MTPDQLLTKADLQAFEVRIQEILQSHLPKGIQTQRKWLRSKEVCKWLNISAGTLQNLRDQGAIPFTQLGSTYFYPFSEIEKRLAKNQPSSPRPDESICKTYE